jgi:GT2 family glycosyltransferase
VSPPIGIVLVTRDRRAEVLATLPLLEALPERPPVVVVDNASRDGTPAAVRRAHPDVRVLALPVNLGGAARTLGVRALGAPLVAFADDDSDWAPGALARAVDLLAAHPRVVLLAARVLVGAARRPDPVCAAMAAAPLGTPRGLPGPAVLGFLACGAVVRRDAFLAAGGFHPRFGIGGEEELLALDLAARGGGLAYVPELVAHHRPAAGGGRAGRSARQARNALWTAWLRAPGPLAARRTAALTRAAPPTALARALRGAGWVAAERRAVPPALAADVARLWGAGSPPRSWSPGVPASRSALRGA